LLKPTKQANIWQEVESRKRIEERKFEEKQRRLKELEYKERAEKFKQRRKSVSVEKSAAPVTAKSSVPAAAAPAVKFMTKSPSKKAEEIPKEIVAKPFKQTVHTTELVESEFIGDSSLQDLIQPDDVQKVNIVEVQQV